MVWVPDLPESDSSPGTFGRGGLAPPLSEEEFVLLEAARCLRCDATPDLAPCSAVCPADVDVPRFVSALARGSWEEAAQFIFAENLLGASSARICPTEALCEGACILSRQGARPIEIARLERYATALAFQNPWASLRTRAQPTGKRVTVIGAGPAGLVCAGELASLGHAVTLLETAGELGGALTSGTASDRSDPSPLPDEVRAILELGVELYLDSPITTPEALWQIEATSDAIFLGIGVDDARPSHPGAHLPGVFGTVEFLDRVRRSPLPEGARVAVLGAGDAAIEVAREAVRLGAAEVTILGQRAELEMPAYSASRAAARAEGIRLLRITGPLRFLGSERLTGIECATMQFEEPYGSPADRQNAAVGSHFILQVDMAVKVAGQEPRLELLRWIDGLDMEWGRPRVDAATGQTTNPRYFADGVMPNGDGTILAAVRAGKRAARGIDRWLHDLPTA